METSPADQDRGLARLSRLISTAEKKKKKKREERKALQHRKKTVQDTRVNEGLRVSHLDRLTSGGYFLDYNYYIPFKVKKQRHDDEFYEGLKKLGEPSKSDSESEQLSEDENVSDDESHASGDEWCACSRCKPPRVTLEDKLKELRMLLGQEEEVVRKDKGDEEEGMMKLGGGSQKKVKGGENQLKTDEVDTKKAKKKGGENKFKKEKGVDDAKKVREMKDKIELKEKKKEVAIDNNLKDFDDKKKIESSISQPIKTWQDIKINCQKHPLDPSCYGNEIIKKIIQKKKPKRRLKVPFTCQSELPQRLNQEMEQHLFELTPNTSNHVAMVLNIGRNRPLYQEQYDNVEYFENPDNINVNWAKFAASAVQTNANSPKVSRMLIPVLCDKLVKLIEFNDELKIYDSGVDYGINKKVGVDEVSKNGEEKEEPEGEEKKVKRVSAIVKNVVAKLVDTVVADEESSDVNAVTIVSEKRVGRELKRLNASYIELEEQEASPKLDDSEEDNLARVEKEYHQTVLKKNNEIIFVNNKNKRLRRRPLKLEDHVLEVADNEERDEERPNKCRRTEGSNEIKTEEIRRVEASVEHELSNPPVKDCSVKLVKSLNLDIAINPSNIEEKNDLIDETYVEDTCSLPDFQIEIPEKVISPPMFKLKQIRQSISPPKKMRRIEEKKSPGKVFINGEIIENPTLQNLLKSQKVNDTNSEAMENRFMLEKIIFNEQNSSTVLVPEVNCRPNTVVGVLSDEVSIHPAVARKRIKVLKPLRRVEEPVRKVEEPVRRVAESVGRVEEPVGRVEEPAETVIEEPEMTVKIQSVMSLNPEISVIANRKADISQENDIKVRFLKVPINQQLEHFFHRDKELEVGFAQDKLIFASAILRLNTNNEVVFIPANKACSFKYNEDKYFGVYFHRQTHLTAFVGPYQLDEEPEIYIKCKSEPECKFVGDFCENGDFVIAFWKCHNREFERRICKDSNIKHLAVYVYRRRNQENSAIKSFLNVSLEADKLAEKNRQSSICLNPVKNFRIKPLGENRPTKNCVANASANSPAVDNRSKSPDLDIVKMEIDFESSFDNSAVSTITSKQNQVLEKPVSENKSLNNASPEVEQTVNRIESKTDSVIDKNIPTHSSSESQISIPISKINSMTTKNKQPKMENKVIDKPKFDNLESFHEYATNMNKLALNNVELTYKQIEENSKARKNKMRVNIAPKEKVTAEFKKLLATKELEIVRKNAKRMEDENSNKQTKDKTQGSNESKGIATIDLCETEGKGAIAKPSVSVPVSKLNIAEKNATIPVKKQPTAVPLGFRRIEPKLVSPDQGPQKIVLKIATSKSILNPLKVIPVSQIPPAGASAKSILKYHTEQRILQSLPQQASQQKMLAQATKAGSQTFNIQLLPQKTSPLKEITPQQKIIENTQQKIIENTPQQKIIENSSAAQQKTQESALTVQDQKNASQKTLQKPPSHVSSNLMKLLEEKLALQKQTVSQQTPQEKKLIEPLNKTVSEGNSNSKIIQGNNLVQPPKQVSQQTTSQHVTDQKMIHPTKIIQKSLGQHNMPQTLEKPGSTGKPILNNQVTKMIRLEGNKILVKMPMGKPLMGPKCIALQKNANGVVQIPAELMSQMNRKEIGVGKFIKIPFNGQNFQIVSPSNSTLRTNLPSSTKVQNTTASLADHKASKNASSEASVRKSSNNVTPLPTLSLADLKTSKNASSETSINIQGKSLTKVTPLPTLSLADLKTAKNASRETSINTPSKSSTPVVTSLPTPVTDTTCVRTSHGTSTSTGQRTLQIVDITDDGDDTPSRREETSKVLSEKCTNNEETSLQVEVLNVSNASTTKPREESQQLEIPNVNDESTSQNELSQIGDTDAQKIMSNWKYNTKYMQSLGLFVDEEDF